MTSARSYVFVVNRLRSDRRDHHPSNVSGLLGRPRALASVSIVGAHEESFPNPVTKTRPPWRLMTPKMLKTYRRDPGSQSGELPQTAAGNPRHRGGGGNA